MSFDKLIFTLDNVREVRKVSINIDDFDQYAQEVQRNYLEKILGVELYTALQNDLDGSNQPIEQRFIDLIDGVQYNIGSSVYNFRGVKLYCSYLWMYNYMLNSDNQLTPIGAMIFKDDHADHSEGKQAMRQSRDHYLRTADGQEDHIVKYLSNNLDLYPEFSSSCQTKTANEENITFKVVGISYTQPFNYYD
jgi:hypothetical protein